MMLRIKSALIALFLCLLGISACDANQDSSSRASVKLGHYGAAEFQVLNEGDSIEVNTTLQVGPYLMSSFEAKGFADEVVVWAEIVLEDGTTLGNLRVDMLLFKQSDSRQLGLPISVPLKSSAYGSDIETMRGKSATFILDMFDKEGNTAHASRTFTIELTESP